jgi:hypothetical protein
MSLPQPRDLARQILRNERERKRISVAIARQMMQLAPRYEEVPFADQSRTVGAVLEAIGAVLGGAHEVRLLDTIDDVFAERARDGLLPSDFALATHCYLPVLRRYFCEQAPNLELGIAAYEAVEGVTLPLMRHIIELALEARDLTDPGFRVKPMASDDAWVIEPMLVERVDD